MVAVYATPPSSRIYWRRTRKKKPCPICGKYGWCELSDDGNLAHCMHSSSDRAMQFRGGGWLHELGIGGSNQKSEIRSQNRKGSKEPETSRNSNEGNNDKENAQPPTTHQNQSIHNSPPSPQPTALSPQLGHEIFQTLLGICRLSLEHRAYLENEGLAGEMISGCGTLRYSQATEVARQLVAQFGENICSRHPALLKVSSKDGKRRWWTIASAADGILFPAYSVEGQISGIQLRKDNPRGKDDRYRWLSHSGLGGTPLTVFQANPDATFPEHLIITEGYKKAAVAASSWQCGAISLAGVTAYKSAELIGAIEKLGVSSVSLAFDQDKREKRQVQEAEQKLVRLLAAALPRITVTILNWNGEKGKGLDEALKAGAEFRLEPATINGPRLMTDLPASLVARHFTAHQPLYSVEEARQQHQQLLERLILYPDGSKTVITSTTGTGKSRAADEAIATALFSGWLSERVLLLAPNKANITERTRPDTRLGQAVASGLAVIQRGRRLIDLTKPYTPQAEDCANPQAAQAGAARQAAAKFVCRECPFGSVDNWEKSFPGKPRGFECETQGYLASRAASRAAQVVIATKDAFLNNSKELAKFGVIICDEEILPFLLESGITVSSEVLQSWRDKIGRRGLVAPAWEKLFSLIELTLDSLSREEQQLEVGRLLDIRPYLEKIAQGNAEDMVALVQECESESLPSLVETIRYEAYQFEIPYRHNAQLLLPYRAATSLIKCLTNPSTPLYGLKDNSGAFRLELIEVREHLVKILESKTVVILDSTLPPQLKMLLPALKEVCYQVPQSLEISQITNALYTHNDLYRPQTRLAIGQAIADFSRNSQNHLTILPLRFREGESALPLPSGTKVEHWGLHRATNQFSDCDSLAVVGHHLRPLDRIIAEVRAIQLMVDPDRVVADSGTTSQKLRLYNYQNSAGFGAGLWRQSQPDPQIQAAIEHDYASHIIQAIGRLRAALRPTHLPPARVLILCNEPVGNLPINTLTTVRKLTNPPKTAISSNSYLENFPDSAGFVSSLAPIPDQSFDSSDSNLIRVSSPADEVKASSPMDEITVGGAKAGESKNKEIQAGENTGKITPELNLPLRLEELAEPPTYLSPDCQDDWVDEVEYPLLE